MGTLHLIIYTFFSLIFHTQNFFCNETSKPTPNGLFFFSPSFIFFNSSLCKHKIAHIMASCGKLCYEFLVCFDNVPLFMCVVSNFIIKAHFCGKYYGMRYGFCVHISKTWPLNCISNDVSKNAWNLFSQYFAFYTERERITHSRTFDIRSKGENELHSDMSIFEPPLYAFTKFFSFSYVWKHTYSILRSVPVVKTIHRKT